jgi:hypothetical protein
MMLYLEVLLKVQSVGQKGARLERGGEGGQGRGREEAGGGGGDGGRGGGGTDGETTGSEE